MAEHTPGPWTLDRADEEQWEIHAETAHAWKYIATVKANDEGSTQVSVAEAEANARLIAASPDLLAALEWALQAWDAIGGDVQIPDSMNDEGRWEAIRAALARARGQ